MKKELALLALAAGLSTGGCATVLNGTNIDYSTETSPTGADVVFLGGLSCTSPCELEMRRGSDTRVDITKDGYESVYVLIQSRLGGSTSATSCSAAVSAQRSTVAMARATSSLRVR